MDTISADKHLLQFSNLSSFANFQVSKK